MGQDLIHHIPQPKKQSNVPISPSCHTNLAFVPLFLSFPLSLPFLGLQSSLQGDTALKTNMACKLGHLFGSIVQQSTPRFGLLSSSSSSSSVSSKLSSSSTSRLVHSSTRLLQKNQQPQEDSHPLKLKEHTASETENTLENDDENIDYDKDGVNVNRETGEVGGPRGPEPTRYGDWERNGRCSDF